MGIIGFILLLFVVGLIFSGKGDGFMDTLRAGCSGIFGIILIIIIVIVVIVVLASGGL
jgi:hypothetical protein